MLLGSSEMAVPAISQVCIVEWIYSPIDRLGSVRSMQTQQVGSVRECPYSLRQEWVAWPEMLAVCFREFVACMQLLVRCMHRTAWDVEVVVGLGHYRPAVV